MKAEHRQHAVVELVVRDLKDQALAHFPSGNFAANSAWTVIACVAHNLMRWISVIGLAADTTSAARTLRRRLLQISGRLTRAARQWTLHLPARWPWQHDFVRVSHGCESRADPVTVTVTSGDPPNCGHRRTDGC